MAGKGGRVARAAIGARGPRAGRADASPWEFAAVFVFLAGMTHVVDLSSNSCISDGSCDVDVPTPATSRPLGVKRSPGGARKKRRKTSATMRIPLDEGKAAVGASCGSEEPFEEESQENQLPTCRAQLREHAATGGGPPSAPAISVAGGKTLRLTPGSSAVGDLKLRRDIGASMTRAQQEKFGGFEVFQKPSPLWTALAQETRERKSVTGSGKCDGEYVFCLFNVLFQEDFEASLLRHNNVWTNGMKSWHVDEPSHWKKLLEDVPRRPESSNTGRPSASVPVKILTPSPQKDMKGMLAKYNCQYRRPSPHEFTMLEAWTKSKMSTLSPGVFQLFLGDLLIQCEVDFGELKPQGDPSPQQNPVAN